MDFGFRNLVSLMVLVALVLAGCGGGDRRESYCQKWCLGD